MADPNANLSGANLPSKLPIKICASFVADPLQGYIEYWNQELHLNVDLTFAPYNQVFQQLFDANSVVNKAGGLNILFVRPEDWLREKRSQTEIDQKQHIREVYKELLLALESAHTFSTTPFLIGIVPSSNFLSSEIKAVIEELMNDLKSFLQQISNFHLFDCAQVAALYEVHEIFDPKSDELGHIPFSEEFHAALATFLVRKICAFKGHPGKAIIVDCDNTLWKGICGEIGPRHVNVNEHYQYLQKFLIRKYDEGFLLALCSKNNEEDVWEVFDHNAGMLLKREHIAAYRINWAAKPDNLSALSKELNIGLDSFVFLDDSEFETEQVTQAHPEVNCITLPEDSSLFRNLFEHLWVLDRFDLTTEDRQRNSMYQAERSRDIEKSQHTLLEDFIKSLNIEITVRDLNEHDLERAVQLAQRTNQFNLNGIRKSRDEIKHAADQADHLCWIIEVKDRFGDYGIVGLVIAHHERRKLIIDTLLLSCRVLGRNIEYFISQELQDYCFSKQSECLIAKYQPTGRNKPVENFLSANWRLEEDGSYSLNIISYQSSIA